MEKKFLNNDLRVLAPVQMLIVFVKCGMMRGGKGCGTYVGKRDTFRFWLRNLKEGEHLEDLGAEG
jgi:hypothetical protein